jgi:hypothetical protein
MMKKFRVQIKAYQHKADFDIEALDTAVGIENAILDKIGRKDISFVEDKHLQKNVRYITYEEIVNGIQSHQGSLPQEKIA